MYKVITETIDLENEEFQLYLKEHSITSRSLNIVHAQPGGGEDVEYTSSTRETLANMFREWWGDDEEFISEQIQKISEG